MMQKREKGDKEKKGTDLFIFLQLTAFVSFSARK
jgi:hypothetical protein